MGYFKDAARGVSWSAALRITIRACSLLRVFILVRLLTPTDFGLFGIAVITLAFLEVLLETGVNVFLIQEKSDIKKYISSAWIVSIARGIVMSVILILSSPYIAEFFHSPASYGVLLLIGVVPFLRGFINPSIVFFQKNIEFHKEFIYRVSLFLIDTTITVALAWLTRSVYSLVVGVIVAVIIEIIASFIIVKPRPTFSFNTGYLKLLFHRGKWVTVFGIFAYLAKQGDTIIVGRLLGSTALGKYNVAYIIGTVPIEAGDIVNQVVFPVYAKFADDKQRLWRAFIRTSGLLAVTIGIVSLLIFLLTPFALPIILGNQWVSIIPIVQLIAIYGMLRAVFGASSPLFLAVKKQNYVTAMTFSRFAGLALTIIPFVSMFGIIGAAYSIIVSVVVEIPVVLYFVYSVFKK